MRIKNLVLKNFRNYESEEFTFADGLNVLYGKNAQGKTNCAEALFYLCTGASPRTGRDRQLIRAGQGCANIAASSAQTRFGSVTIEADIYENKRELRVNGSKIAKNADLLGNINGVFFSPGELRMVQDGPEERRRFLNVSISQLSRSYYTALVRYNKILEQRNALLKNRDLSLVFETLPVWDVQLCRYASEIICRRAEFIQMLAPPRRRKARLSLGRGGGTARHLRKKIPAGQRGDRQNAPAGIFRQLRAGRPPRLYGDGPHRDDLKLTIGGSEVRVYGSQGQARTAALALKLAEVDIFRSVAGEPPVLILDDVMSELDLSRRRKLLSQIEDVQTILTCTHTEKVLFGKTVNKIRIVAGKIKR